VRELVLARHAESEFNVLERLNGDATVEVTLTDRGRE
jgi:broad specificity phosphatase PhoE